MNLYPRRRRGCGTWPIVAWFLAVGLGIWLAWYGFTWSERSRPPAGTPAPVAAVADTPAPVTATQPAAARASAYVVAGDDGVNVRTGPGTNYTRLGYLDPGARAEVTGRASGWWQIQYGGGPGWVFGGLVTAHDADQAEPPPAAGGTPDAQAGPLPAGVEGWPAEVFRLINSARAENGLPPYTYDETLALAAQRHGQDCQQRGECSHTGSDGSDVQTRIRRAGYDASGQAEVIVYSSSPQAAVDWWMDEVPPDDWHRRTLLSDWVTEVGIAVVPTGRGDYYFIAVFGRPAGP